jgi:hypothetical protein
MMEAILITCLIVGFILLYLMFSVVDFKSLLNRPVISFFRKPVIPAKSLTENTFLFTSPAQTTPIPSVRNAYMRNGTWTTNSSVPAEVITNYTGTITVPTKPKKTRKPRTKKIKKDSVYKNVPRIIDIEAEI